MKHVKSSPLQFILIFYVICFLFRMVEYLWIRTDQSIIGEAFIHKLLGIFLLAAAIKFLQYSWPDIGFCAAWTLKGISIGLLFGTFVFAVAYGLEITMQTLAGNTPSLQFYVTSYAIQGNRSMQDGATFILVCIMGNLINVIMEEGVFRGLFIRLAQEKYTFAMASLLSSLLFGVWHIMQPIRNVLDGQQSFRGALISGLLLIVTSTFLGIQCAMLFKITGSLWVGMAAHFVNNAITNLLHVVTATGFDELQILRITIAQSLSFIIVLAIFLFKHKKEKQNQ